MNGSIFFRSVDGSGGLYEWVVMDEFGNPSAASRGGIEELVEKSNGRSATMLFDAGLVRTTSIQIPGRSRHQLRQAAPYALEDEIADDVEDVDVVLGPAQNDIHVVAVVNRQLLESSITPVLENGVQLERIVLDALLIPSESNALTIMIDDSRYYIKYGEYFCTAIDRSNAPLVLARLVRQHRPATARILTAVGAEPQAAELLQINAACVPVSVDIETYNEDTLPWLVRQFNSSSAPALDLLPEKHTRRTDGLRIMRSYKIAAGIFALALAAHIFLDWYDVSQKKSALEAIKSAQEETFRNAFPGIRRVVNAEAQSRQLLAELREQGPPPADFLKVLHSSAAILERDDLGITLTGLTFADGVLLLRTESPDMERIEKYRAALTENMIAEVVTAESSGDAIRGAIRVRAGEP